MSIVSRPATQEYRDNYPFGPTKFERELVEEKSSERPLVEEGWVCHCGTWNVVDNSSTEAFAKSRCKNCGRGLAVDSDLPVTP